MYIAPIKMNYASPISFSARASVKEGLSRDLPETLKSDKTENDQAIAQLSGKQYRPNIDTKYYCFNWNTQEEVSVNVIERKDSNGVKRLHMVTPQGGTYPFFGRMEKTHNGEMVEKADYLNGFPYDVTEYKDGKPLRHTQYDDNHIAKQKIVLEEVFGDTSYRIERKYDLSGHWTKLYYDEATKDKDIKITMVAPGYTDDDEEGGSLTCTIRKYYKNGDMKMGEGGHWYFIWNFPEIERNNISPTKNKEIINALKHLQDVICSPKYKNHFGQTDYLNTQLRNVIKNLEGETQDSDW